jgi:IstB-like ATP binding protein
MSGAEVSVTNTAAHTADTPQLLLEHHLKELRLPTILREYDKVGRQCAVEQLDYQRYLLRMTELELLDRERRATERRIRQAKFPVVKTMDSFDFLTIPSLNKTLALELARCEFQSSSRERSAVGQQRHWENAHRPGSGPSRMPARTPRALHHHCRVGQRVD